MIGRWWRAMGATLIAGSLLLGAAGARAAEEPPAQGAAQWAVLLEAASLYAGPSEDTKGFGLLKALSPVQVLGYDGDWAYIYEPHARGTAYVRADLLGPSDSPSPYLLKRPPDIEEPLAERGLLTASAPLAVYPTDDEEAADAWLRPNTWLSLDASVRGEDGSLWYRTRDGQYVPADSVFLPSRPDAFAGRWIDVNLSAPARVTAYEADERVRSFLTIKGAGPRPTPTGVFTIVRRVANETMNSDTIGIPRFGPGGYYLTNVLFTQYFTGDGASFHYNYWSSAFGYAGSHGCLGLSYADSAFLWEWANVGTPLIIHY